MKQSRKNSGFTVVELLLAVAIMAMLLASVAIAMQAALGSYRENEKIAEVMQMSRAVLNRMMSEVRTADAVNSESPQHISIIPPLNSIIPPLNSEHVTEIEYELVDGALYYRRTVNGEEVTQTFISSDENVQIQFTVTTPPELGTAVDEEGVTYTYIKSVTINLTLSSGSNTFKLTASACPRRNQTL